MRFPRAFFLGFGLAIFSCAYSQAQAALFMESADGIPSLFNPTGHEAVYFARICAETPTHLRRCHPGELGVVISRYQGIAGYDWLAVPLVPYLYSVEDAADVPERVNRETVKSLRLAYHAAHLASLGTTPQGGRIKRGWIQLLGASYERRIYAFRFETTAGQDDAFIAWMNDSANRSHFNLLFHNCSDFASRVLNFYFPGTFRRHWAPDAGITTPRQVAYELVQERKPVRVSFSDWSHRSYSGTQPVCCGCHCGRFTPVGLVSVATYASRNPVAGEHGTVGCRAPVPRCANRAPGRGRPLTENPARRNAGLNRAC